MSTDKLVFDILERMVNDTSSDPLKRQITSWANGVQWFDKYADGRDAPKGIVSGNWNDLDRYNPDTKQRETVSTVPSRMCKLFEAYGVEIEWCDQVSSCDDCNGCIQTQPDSYSWTPEFVVGDGSIICAECAKDNAEKLLKEQEGETSLWSLASIDPSDHGYIKLNEDAYESGWHQGQTDDPRTVAKELEAKGIKRFLFAKDEQSQFYCKWSAYVHKTEAHKLLGPEARDVKVSEDEYSEACDEYQGWCPHCKAFTRDATEPDAEGYDCPECERSSVVGAEQALLLGLINIT